MIDEPRGAYSCRSSTLVVFVNSGPFRGLLHTVLADSGPFLGLLLTVLGSWSDFHD